MTYWLFDPCTGNFRRFLSFEFLFKCYVQEVKEARGFSDKFSDWICPFRDHSMKTMSAFYEMFTGEFILKSRYSELRDLYRAAYRAGLMQRFFSGVKPVPTRRYYDKSSS